MPAAAEPLYWRKTTILLGVETSYGVGDPPGAAQALRVRDAEITPLDAQTIDLKYVTYRQGATEKAHVRVHRSAKYTCDLTGSGTVAMPPGYGPALRACGMAETVRAATAAATIQPGPGTPGPSNDGSWTYATGAAYGGSRPRTVTVTVTTPGGSGVAKVTVAAPAVDGLPAYQQDDVTVTDDAPLALPGGATILPDITDDLAVGDSWTILLYPACVQYRTQQGDYESGIQYFYGDGTLYRMRGTRGTGTISFAENEVPKIAFDTKGLWEPAVDEQPPVAAPVNFARPVVLGMVNTPIARLHGVDVVLKSLEINLGMAVSYTDRPGRAEVRITDHPVTGTITFQYPKLADWDVELAARNHELGPLTVIHGLSAGNVVQVDGTNVQITEPKRSEDEGIVMCTANLTFVLTDAASDDFVLTLR